jgi:hypothetical protein
MRTLSLGLGLLLAGPPLFGQALLSRILKAPDGEVRLAFAAREGLCGDGATFIRDRTRGDDNFVMYNGSWSGSSKNWRTRPCEEGPVRVALKVRGGLVRTVRPYVGGDWPAAGSNTTDLGRVSPQAGTEALLALAGDSNQPGAEDALFPTTLADSVTIWPALMRLAKNGSAPRRSRNSSVFWLSQIAGDAATKGLQELVEDESDREIREQAVFGLSQLPKDEGVPILIRIAKTHRDPAVRRKALFWLGQSQDPRALTLFEEILTRS